MWFFFYPLESPSIVKGRLARKRIGNFLSFFFFYLNLYCAYSLFLRLSRRDWFYCRTAFFPFLSTLWLALMIGPPGYCFNALAIFKGRRRLRKKNAYLITIHIVSGLVLWSYSWFLGWLEFQRKVKEGKEEKTCNELNKEGRQGKEKIELQT